MSIQPLPVCSDHMNYFLWCQRLPNGPSSILDDGEVDRQREGEIERQRSELGQLKERLALMCRQVPQTPYYNSNWMDATLCVNKYSILFQVVEVAVSHVIFVPLVRLARLRSSWHLPGENWRDLRKPTTNCNETSRRSLHTSAIHFRYTYVLGPLFETLTLVQNHDHG